MADDRLIVALDVHTFSDARMLIDELGDDVSFYKVGMELFYSVGEKVLTYLNEKNKKIFLDLKLHDIPNTVAGGLCSLLQYKVSMVNVHASGGYTMMKTAKERLCDAAKRSGVEPPKIIAVTVLTSMNDDDWKKIGETEKISDRVIRLASLAKEAGLDGVVASPEEASSIRETCGDDFFIVTPGIRPIGSSVDDQSRISSPGAAIKNGATHIVVGRPIRMASDPKTATKNILAEMGGIAV